MREFLILMLILETALIGTFAALGQYAQGEMMQKPEVVASLKNFGKFSGAPKLKALMAQASPATQLFNLHRSKNFRRDKQQYVIFVTPEMIRTAGAGTEDITRKFRLKAGEQ